MGTCNVSAGKRNKDSFLMEFIFSQERQETQYMETLQSVVEVVCAMGKAEVGQNKGEAGL